MSDGVTEAMSAVASGDTHPTPAPVRLSVDGAEATFPVHHVLCLGRNYADHVAEMGGTAQVEDLPFFTKWADAILPVGADAPGRLAYPPETAAWHFEVELVAAIGVGGAAIEEARALDHVWGYAVGVDMTRRDLQARSKTAGTPWDWAKNGVASTPVGPLRPVSRVGHPTAGRIALSVDGGIRQEGDLSQMIWSTARTIAYLSRFFPLAPGDLIFTGTPAGVGPIEPGERMRAEIEGLAPIEALVEG